MKMGIEVNLFYAKLKKPIKLDHLQGLFEILGCHNVSSEAETHNFEISTKDGITEVQVRAISDVVTDFSIRFSFGNPKTVIGQTFDFINNLAKRLPLDIYDVELMERLVLSKKSVARFKELFGLRKDFFDAY